MNKKQLIEIADISIEGYKNNSLTHCSNTCPLCQAFDDNPSCKGCPNTVFKTLSGEGCAVRGDLYPNLAYRKGFRVTTENDAVLAQYWTEIRDYLISKQGKRLSWETFSNKIIEIAEKYK